jgi:hypothetical protein
VVAVIPVVTNKLVGKFKYVVAEIVLAVNPPFINVFPLTCSFCVGNPVPTPTCPLVVPDPCMCTSGVVPFASCPA